MASEPKKLGAAKPTVHLKREAEKKNKRNMIIISVFIGAIFLISTFAFPYFNNPLPIGNSGQGGDEKNKPPGYRNSDGDWVELVLIMDRQTGKPSYLPVAFRYSPEEVKEYRFTSELFNKFVFSNKIYLAFNPNIKEIDATTNQSFLANMQIVMFELTKGIEIRNKNAVAAYTEDSDPIDERVPIKSCKDANNEILVIHMQSLGEGLAEPKMNQTDLQNNNCIVISGDGEYLRRVASAVSMQLFGVEFK